MAAPVSAIVVGAGPGGLAAALALLGAGLRVTVVERAPALVPLGAGLTLFPNGLRVLDRIDDGLGAAVASVGCECREVVMCDDLGAALHVSRPTLRERFGFGMINLRWSDLTARLAARLPADALRLGVAVAAAEPRDDGVLVRFADGSSERVDVLVAADGVGSSLRPLVVDDGPPVYTGHASWRLLLPPRPDLLPPHRAAFYMARPDQPRRSVGLFDLGARLFVSAGALASVAPAGGPGARERVLAEFRGFAGEIAALFEAADDDAILERPLWDRPPARALVRGRIALLGDAAHPVEPSLGQGANLAFEDAWVLGRALAGVAAGDVPAALAAYERERLPRIAVVQAMSRRRSEASYEADALASARAALERLQGDPGAFEAWLYGYPPAS